MKRRPQSYRQIGRNAQLKVEAKRGRFILKMLKLFAAIGSTMEGSRRYAVGSWIEKGWGYCTNGHTAYRIKMDAPDGVINRNSLMAALTPRVVFKDGELTIVTPTFHVAPHDKKKSAPNVQRFFDDAKRHIQSDKSHTSVNINPAYLLEVAKMIVAARWESVTIVLPKQPFLDPHDEKSETYPIIFMQAGNEADTYRKIKADTIELEKAEAAEPDMAIIMPMRM